MALVQNFNVDPYYDDYEEDRKFLRLLYRPGYAIQARELTQLQTILQKQISRFGKHIFKNGSVVTGGEISISSSVFYHKLQTTTVGGEDIDVNNFLGKNIGNAHALLSGGSLGKVVAVTPATDTDPPTIYVEYKTNLILVNDETLFTIDNEQFEARLISSESTGKTSVAHINEGVYFIDDFFVKVSTQSLLLEKYTNIVNLRVGLSYDEKIIDEKDDTSLLDPALNSSNYQAPGATRYQVTLTLDKKSLTSTDDTKFIEIIRLLDGNVVLKNNYPLYSELEKTLARRTYDESGNYTVNPFSIFLQNHLPNNLSELPNTSLFTVTLSAGKAYVRGFEIETISPTNIEIEKARDTQNVENYDISCNYGNYVIISNTSGLFDISTISLVDMHNVDISLVNTVTSNAYSSTKIGTVRIRDLQYLSASDLADADSFKYTLYLDDTRFDANGTIKDIQSFVVVNTNTQIVASANVDSLNRTANSTFFSDTDFKTLVFRIPQSFVEFGMTDQDYRGRVIFRNQTVTGGLLSISTGSINDVFVGSGNLSDAQKLNHFYVVANNATGSEFVTSEVIPFTSTTGRTISVSTSTADLDFNSSNTFTADVIASIDFNVSSPKTKTLVSSDLSVVANSGGTTIGNTTVYLTEGQVAISTPNKTPGLSDSLYISDIFKLEGVFEEEFGYFQLGDEETSLRSSFRVIDSGDLNSAVVLDDLTDFSKDITNRYILDDGQRDGYYDHGSIVLKPGASPPSGQILVLVNYFTHIGSGYFSLDSYNFSSFGSFEDLRYSKIPNFTSPTTGEVYKLRDCIDFRPVRVNASNTSPNFSLVGASLPRAGESLESDYSYYLPRIDRIILSEDKKFRVLKGVSSLNPQTPFEPENAMTLYTIRVNPFTFFPADTRLRFFENKRYTMRDIGKIEKRVENLEYYTTLNTLEKSAQDLVILDDNGLTRFKNGILVDSFRGHQVGDVKNIDYLCSMDFFKGEMHPYFNTNDITFENDVSSTANVSAGSIATLPYTIVPAVVQDVATNALSINPFTLSNYAGVLKISPPGDFWIDTNRRPDVLVNLEGENDAWDQIGRALADGRSPGFGTQYGDWKEFKSDVSVDTSITTKTRSEGYLDYEDTVQTTKTTTFYSKERTGTETILVPERIVKSIGLRQVDLSVIPYIRSQWLTMVAKGLKPNAYHSVFIDQNQDITDYVEYPSIAWLYDVNGNFNDEYGVYERVNSSSGGRAILVKQVGRSWSLEQPSILLSDVRGTFAANDVITGVTSGATARIDVMFWNNGNVISATASTITLGSGAPYDKTYVDIQKAYTQINWPQTGIKILEDPKESTEFYRIRIIAGKGIGQERLITKYDNFVATVVPNWTVIPNNTSRWTVGKIQTDDSGIMAGRLYLPNYSKTSYNNGFNVRTGSRLFRVINQRANDVSLANSFAEEFFHAQGVLNTVENVSVSVRVPTIKVTQLYEREDNTRKKVATQSEVIGTTLIADRTPPPPPPPPPPPQCSSGSYTDTIVGSITGVIFGGNSGRYTDDSDIATAAVHAGLLSNGETGSIRVRRLSTIRSNYQSITQNGITSRSYEGEWCPITLTRTDISPPPPPAEQNICTATGTFNYYQHPDWAKFTNSNPYSTPIFGTNPFRADSVNGAAAQFLGIQPYQCLTLTYIGEVSSFPAGGLQNGITSSGSTRPGCAYQITALSSFVNASGYCEPVGGGGGSKCKIICTKLHELGFLPANIYDADQAFGRKLIETRPDIYNGYVAWAKVVVDWMEGNGPQCMIWIRDEQKRKETQQKLAVEWAKKIATPWAKHMAYVMGVETKDSVTGKILMTVGAPICKVIGWWQRKFGVSEKKPGIIKGYALWLIFAILRFVVTITSIFEDKK